MFKLLLYIFQCMLALVMEAPFMYTNELDNVLSLCFRALDGSNYDVRCDVSKLIGALMAATQQPRPPSGKFSIR